jgi:hypothetical protein
MVAPAEGNSGGGAREQEDPFEFSGNKMDSDGNVTDANGNELSQDPPTVTVDGDKISKEEANEEPRVSPTTDTAPVPYNYIRYSPSTADSYARGTGNRYYTPETTSLPMNDLRGLPGELRGAAIDPFATPERKAEYDMFVSQLRDYSGSKLGTIGSIETAWHGLLKDARRSGVPAMYLLNSGRSGDGSGSGGSGGGGGSRYGTSSSVTHANEADVRVLANTIAENMIGRNLSDKEFSKIYGRFRQGEADSPTVTTTSPGGSVTQQGITAAERQDILEEIIMENPEFSTYQGGEGMLDKMTETNKQVRAENAGL